MSLPHASPTRLAAVVALGLHHSDHLRVTADLAVPGRRVGHGAHPTTGRTR